MTEQETPQAEPQATPQQPQAQAFQPSYISFNTTAPEPQQTPDAYQAIIAQQQAQIDALIAQTNAQSAQITQMVQNGAQFAQPVMQPQQAPQQAYQPQPVQQFPNYYDGANPMQQFNTASLADDKDYSLEGLAEQIGKKE